MRKKNSYNYPSCNFDKWKILYLGGKKKADLMKYSLQECSTNYGNKL
jgi:hypothetical protein